MFNVKKTAICTLFACGISTSANADLGIGVSVGGVDVGVNVGGSDDGISVGAGASVGGLGGEAEVTIGGGGDGGSGGGGTGGGGGGGAGGTGGGTGGDSGGGSGGGGTTAGGNGGGGNGGGFGRDTSPGASHLASATTGGTQGFQSLIGASVWSSDGVLLGMIDSVKAGSGGRVDATVRLSSALQSNRNSIVMRIAPTQTRNGQLRLGMTAHQFASQLNL